MADPFFTAATLDDLMHSVIEAILRDGKHVGASKGANTELTGVLLELTDPRARLSRSEIRGHPFSCLGELCWYLAQTNALSFIEYYLRQYKGSADGDVIVGGYGPRLFKFRRPKWMWWGSINQVKNIIELLRKKETSRRAVIQLFDADDLREDFKDIPCTCTFQFMVREGALQMFTCMRSNDAYLGLPHDIYCFTMIQEIVARSLGVEVGRYRHAVGSIHVYDRNRLAAEQFLAEGWQSTDRVMAPMPIGDPWPALRRLVRAEKAIRTKHADLAEPLDGVDPFWADLTRLLQIFRGMKDRNAAAITMFRDQMSTRMYDPYINRKLAHLSKADEDER